MTITLSLDRAGDSHGARLALGEEADDARRDRHPHRIGDKQRDPLVAGAARATTRRSSGLPGRCAEAGTDALHNRGMFELATTPICPA
jgi:hypothetical protein